MKLQRKEESKKKIVDGFMREETINSTYGSGNRYERYILNKKEKKM